MNKMTLPTELEYNANTRNNYFKQEAKGNVSGQGETDDGLITLENSQEDELEPQRKEEKKKIQFTNLYVTIRNFHLLLE